MIGSENDNYQSDPMKSPLFECFLRLHQLNFICNRIPEEYKKLIKKKEIKPEQELNGEDIKSESESEDSFLSADMSSDDNMQVATSKAFVDQTNQGENSLDEKGEDFVNMKN